MALDFTTDARNEDWLRTLVWDLPCETYEQFVDYVGGENGVARWLSHRLAALEAAPPNIANGVIAFARERGMDVSLWRDVGRNGVEPAQAALVRRAYSEDQAREHGRFADEGKGKGGGSGKSSGGKAESAKKSKGDTPKQPKSARQKDEVTRQLRRLLGVDAPERPTTTGMGGELELRIVTALGAIFAAMTPPNLASVADSNDPVVIASRVLAEMLTDDDRVTDDSLAKLLGTAAGQIDAGDTTAAAASLDAAKPLAVTVERQAGLEDLAAVVDVIAEALAKRDGAAAASVARRAYSPDQARDEHGRFGEGGDKSSDPLLERVGDSLLPGRGDTVIGALSELVNTSEYAQLYREQLEKADRTGVPSPNPQANAIAALVENHGNTLTEPVYRGVPLRGEKLKDVEAKFAPGQPVHIALGSTSLDRDKAVEFAKGPLTATQVMFEIQPGGHGYPIPYDRLQLPPLTADALRDYYSQEREVLVRGDYTVTGTRTEPLWNDRTGVVVTLAPAARAAAIAGPVMLSLPLFAEVRDAPLRATVRRAYSPDQARDEHGRFGEGSTQGTGPVIEGQAKTAELVTMAHLPQGVQDKVMAKLGGTVPPPKMPGEHSPPAPPGGWGLGVSAQQVRDNYEAMFARAKADPDSTQRGMEWYGRVHDEAAMLNGKYGYDMENTAGALAAMSAGTKWETEMPIVETMMKMDSTELSLPRERLDLVNDKLATMGLEPVSNGMPIRDMDSRTAVQVMHEEHMTNGPGGWGASKSYAQYERALDILRDDTPVEQMNGVKVREFYNNISSPGLDGHTAIDVMMMRIAADNPKIQNDPRITGAPANRTVALGPTPFLADEVRRIASAQDPPILANQAQAMMWVQWQKEQAR